MSESSRVLAAVPGAAESSLLRFAAQCIGHDPQTTVRFVSHVMGDDWRQVGTSADAISVQHWTRLARGCREYLEPLEATNWWGAARAAEHAWADPDFSVDVAEIDAQLGRANGMAEPLAVMPAVDRIALLLYDVENMAIPAVAAVMRSSEEAAADRVRRARMTTVCALGPTAWPSAQPSFEWPGEGPCAITRMALLTADRHDLGDLARTAEHLSDCGRCASLATALLKTLDGLAVWAISTPTA